MTAQIEDIIIWKRKKYDLLGYEGEVEELEIFTPRQFGMNPQSLHTACYRGFYCGYKIVRNFLYLDSLCVKDRHDHYPLINEVEATIEEGTGYYSELNYPIKYTGILRIGKDFHNEHYIHMGFQKPSAYGVVWDLKLTDGKITGRKDISDEVKKIEGRYRSEYSSLDISERIDDPFRRDLELR